MADTYINELEINGQKRLDLTQDTATPETVLEGETFHLRSGAPATGTYRPSDEIEARLRATVGHSCKNLLELSGTSETTSGINFTIDKISGTVTTANTATSQTIKLIGEVTNNSDAAKNYWLSGGADNGASNSYYLYAIDDSTGSRPKQWDGVTNSLSSYGLNDSVQIQIPAGHKIRVQILIRNGVNTDGLVFKPMLRDGSIADDTFEPYVTPTDERIVDLEARIAALEAIINNS